MKKPLIIAISSVLLVAIIAWGITLMFTLSSKNKDKDSSSGANQEEPVTVRDSLRECEVKILLGSEQTPDDYQYVVSQINKELAKDGKPYTVKFDFTAINGYMVNLESKVRDKYDGAWAHKSFFSSLTSKKMIKTDIMPYLEGWGQKILAGDEKRFNSATTLNGKVFAIH